MSETIDPRMAKSDTLRDLREKPRYVGGDVEPSTAQRRELVATLSAPTATSASAGTHPGRKTATGVYYLIGDERRAVRRFIEANEEFVASTMDARGWRNVYNGSWPQPLIEMLAEEWAFHQAHGGDEA